MVWSVCDPRENDLVFQLLVNGAEVEVEVNTPSTYS